MHAGIVVVPLNWHWVADEVAYVLDDAEVRALLVDDDFRAVADEAQARLDRDLLVVPIGGDAYQDLLDAQRAASRRPACGGPDVLTRRARPDARRGCATR